MPWRGRMRGVVVVAAALVLAAGCGDGDSGDSDDTDGAGGGAVEDVDETTPGGGGGGGGGGGDDDSDDTEAPAEAQPVDVDDCTLLTSEEVRSLAGRTLVPTEDSPLGCGFAAEGQEVADFGIASFRSGGSAADNAGDVAGDVEVRDVDGAGDDAVALVREDNVNFLVARDGDLFVQLVMTFLDVPPASDAFERAKELATLALQRLREAA